MGQFQELDLLEKNRLFLPYHGFCFVLFFVFAFSHHSCPNCSFFWSRTPSVPVLHHRAACPSDVHIHLGASTCAGRVKSLWKIYKTYFPSESKIKCGRLNADAQMTTAFLSALLESLKLGDSFLENCWRFDVDPLVKQLFSSPKWGERKKRDWWFWLCILIACIPFRFI